LTTDLARPPRWPLVQFLLAILFAGPACEEDNGGADPEVYSRLGTLAQSVEDLTRRLEASEARTLVLEQQLAITQQDVIEVETTLDPLPPLVARASSIAEEWVAGTLMVRSGSDVLGPLLGYYDTALAFVDYNQRVVFVSFSAEGDVPYFGDLYFSDPDCTGVPFIEHEMYVPWFARAGVLDLSSGLVYEDAGLAPEGLNTVRSKKNWRHSTCYNPPAPVQVRSYPAKTRQIAPPHPDVDIHPRSVLDRD
jgi:hypothetical protein